VLLHAWSWVEQTHLLLSLLLLQVFVLLHVMLLLLLLLPRPRSPAQRRTGCTHETAHSSAVDAG
jgi:hypothetical protein